MLLTFIWIESCSFRFPVQLVLAIVALLLWHKMPWTALHGLLSKPRRSLTVMRHQGQRAFQCFQLPRSDVTLSSGWRNPTEERLWASARLWCSSAQWLPWIHYTVRLWNLPCHTGCRVDYQNTQYAFLHSSEYFQSIFSGVCHEFQQSTQERWGGK